MRDLRVNDNNYWNYDTHERFNDNVINSLHSQFTSNETSTKFLSIINNILVAINEPIKNANKYLAYSNVEQIKLLIMHNSKKTIEIWNFEEGQFQEASFQWKSSMTDSIAKFSALM